MLRFIPALAKGRQGKRNTVIGELSLDLPMLNSSDLPAVTPDKVEHWVANLPMANLGETSRLFFKALTDMNKTIMPVKDRIQIMEMFGPPLQHITDSLRNHFIGKPFPLEKKYNKIAGLVERLYMDMAIGHKLAIRDMLSAESKLDKNELGTCIYHALIYIDATLITIYQTYSAYPKIIWKECHQLYEFAYNNNLHEKLINVDEQKCNSIEKIYKSIVLTWMASPNQLGQNEIKQVNEVTSVLGHYANIIASDLPGSISQQFVINPIKDQPPIPTELLDKSKPRHLLGIETEDLVTILQTMIKNPSQQQELGLNIPDETLCRLVLNWGTAAKRGFSRTSQESIVDSSIGLCAAHYFISGEIPFYDQINGYSDLNNPATSGLNAIDLNIPNVNTPAQFTSKVLDTFEHNNSGADVWSGHYTITGQGREDYSDTTRLISRPNSEDDSHHVHKLKMENISAGGFCVSCDNKKQINAKVGELAVMREHADPESNQWTLGTVRRLQYNGHGLELGIQMLSPSAIAVATRIIHKNGERGDYLRGLMAPEIKAINQLASLITPALPYKVDNTLIVNVNGAENKIKLTELLESTNSYSQFLFEAIDEDDIAPAPTDDTGKEDFDSLWTLM